MDLQTVRTTLEADKYATVSQWQADVNLVWANALQYNSADSLYGLAAQYLQQVFTSLTAKLTDNEVADWAAEFQEAQAVIHRSVSESPTFLPVPEQPRPVERPPPERQKPAERPPPVAKKDRGSTKVTKPPRVTELTAEQESELVAIVNALEEDDEINQVIALIREMEPKFRDKEEMDITMTELATKTRVALWALVQKLPKRK